MVLPMTGVRVTTLRAPRSPRYQYRPLVRSARPKPLPCLEAPQPSALVSQRFGCVGTPTPKGHEAGIDRSTGLSFSLHVSPLRHPHDTHRFTLIMHTHSSSSLKHFSRIHTKPFILFLAYEHTTHVHTTILSPYHTTFIQVPEVIIH